MLAYLGLIPSVLSLDLQSVFDEFKHDYGVKYEVTDCEFAEEKLRCKLSFTDKYIKDWIERWGRKPGVEKIVKSLQQTFVMELYSCGLIVIECKEYEKAYLEFLKYELLFHFRDLSHNLTLVIRKLEYGPCSLRRGIDCIGENLNLGDLAREVKNYLKDIFGEGLDLLRSYVDRFNKQLSSFKGRRVPFIWQVGIDEQVGLYELSSLHARRAKDLNATVQRIRFEIEQEFQAEWQATCRDVLAFSDFFSGLADHLSFTTGIYSNQTNVTGVYIGIVGLALSLIGIGLSIEDYISKIFVTLISLFILCITIWRWYHGKALDFIRKGLNFIEQQINPRL